MLGVTWLMGDRAGVGACRLTAQYSLTCSVGPSTSGQPLSLVLLTPWALDKLCPGGSGLGVCWVELLKAALPAGGRSRLSPQSQRGPLPPSWMSPVWLGLSQGYCLGKSKAQPAWGWGGVGGQGGRGGWARCSACHCSVSLGEFLEEVSGAGRWFWRGGLGLPWQTPWGGDWHAPGQACPAARCLLCRWGQHAMRPWTWAAPEDSLAASGSLL